MSFNTATIATAAGDYDLPDECDSMTGAWVYLLVRARIVKSKVITIETTRGEDTFYDVPLSEFDLKAVERKKMIYKIYSELLKDNILVGEKKIDGTGHVLYTYSEIEMMKNLSKDSIKEIHQVKKEFMESTIESVRPNISNGVDSSISGGVGCFGKGPEVTDNEGETDSLKEDTKEIEKEVDLFGEVKDKPKFPF